MKRSELKNGMIIELRDGGRSIIIDNLHVSPKEWGNRTWGYIKDFNNDLTYPSTLTNHNTSDIVKVWDNPRSNMEYFDVTARELIFDRDITNPVIK